MIPQSIIDRGIRDKRHTLNILVIIKSKEELNLKAMWSFSENAPVTTSLRANYSQPEIYDKIAATDTKCKCSVISFGLH
jgi:hypothetical protein